MSEETEIRFNRERHDAVAAEFKKVYETTSAPMSKAEEEWKAPKFWIGEKLIPERAVRKVDPGIFLNEYVQPFVTAFAQAIAMARQTGKAFKIVSYIRFPNYMQLSKKEEEKHESVPGPTN